MIAIVLVPLCVAGLMLCIWVMLWVQKKYSDAILDEQRAGYAHLRSLIAELEERVGLSEPTDVDDDEPQPVQVYYGDYPPAPSDNCKVNFITPGTYYAAGMECEP
jgi:hypothetical protein